MLVEISFPSAEPAGPWTIQTTFSLSNNNDLTGRAYIYKDALLFRFFNHIENVHIDVDLYDEHNAPLAHADVESRLWGVGLQTGEAKYVLFEGFPPRADGSSMSGCAYKLTLTNVRRESSGTRVDVKIYRHTSS
jgi:hypothetical protein